MKDITLLTRAIMGRTMVGRITEVIRGPLRSRLATGRITFTDLVITQATRITSGGQDIGGIVTAREFGSTATTPFADTKPGSTSPGRVTATTRR